ALALPSAAASANGPTITRNNVALGPCASIAGNPFCLSVSTTTPACGCAAAATCRYIFPGPGFTATTPPCAAGTAFFTSGGAGRTGASCVTSFLGGFSAVTTGLVSTGAFSLVSSCAGGAGCGVSGGEAASGRGLVATVVDGSEAAEAGAEFRPTT